MKQRKLFIRIVCIFLAILMLGGVVIGAIQAFAFGPEAMNIVATGDNNNKHNVLIIAIIAVVVFILVSVLPKILKNRK
ncbi:MAG: hypothetical protein MJ115_03990 [Clostridia bacterium]|nr:hypothetical protein [Clostridia bacterium]